ncbi:50S ribosomal protein L23 [Campylobacter pinnipediorum]|uniref:Large ribosomal subunit protein uL23 n=2 Tax=Campylobacter pinnipediorum TaxID=1965231 RepID=A0A1S6U5J3_9BACT|nr:50S ribosomal protein L23 [Campylobacter pinnipediorum]AQW80488.1 50S ribosomal protein L23 [Campylobacter pinnipediorum subsp. pinnipediorum]AQW82157.1 50S ribosomal protein L23 [Campylobacter pinnipediorum subsp. pinnipediorum]AQW83834.1 50S ribosomal protein L23 [Campylobacter pinnipediorum subsp. pinnipediorum]AQW85353.1 50S ribosomal protein L23 [Campylobacter pinnipediorum subsp. caledonicus]AQW86962.1 50S ribosomal protein L23 [Campylobacter pinnipediorum subsp. caledonicus]
MADITDIKTIIYTEKTLGLQENGVVVIQTSPRVTKNGLKEVLKEYFGVTPLQVNSLRVNGKVKRFRGRIGVRDDVKKFYVKLPEGVSLENTEA